MCVSNYQHTTAEGDPADVPIRHATTVVIVRDDPQFEVLMVQRTSRVAFGPSAWVFPGGRVDPEDAIDSDDVITGLTDAEASALLDIETGGLAWWIAGIRETVEESGLLLVDSTSEPSTASIGAVRQAVHEDSSRLVPALREHGLRVDLGAMHEVARFVTPVGPPRRFDTRFLLACAPPDQPISPDHGEIVATRWVQPEEALSMWRGDEFPLMSVTVRILACLGRYESAEAVLAKVKHRPPTRRVRVDDPKGEYRVLLPEDPGYESAELEVEHGWVRL